MKAHLNGVIAGYDPGGNNCHGFAALQIKNGAPTSITTQTLPSADSVISLLDTQQALVGVGVDTLTCWSTGPSGWRPADQWLRQRYPEVQNSVVAANSLFGSMGINGMAVLIYLRARQPQIWITETHPKVMYWHLAQRKYDFERSSREMTSLFESRWQICATPNSEHEWDAAISALAAYEGLVGNWQHDLHNLSCTSNERIIRPCGATSYVWPTN